MTGFWPLMRKEILEQHRTWKFLAMAIVFTLIAVLGPTIFRIVAAVQDKPLGLEEAREVLGGVGATITFLGTFLAIFISMGSLAGERASGTAAMTLSKPVSRSAFVTAKLVGLALTIVGALAIAGTVVYVLVLLLLADGGPARFALGIGVSATLLLFVASVAFFWSAMFSRPLLAGGITLAVYVVLNILRAVPHAERYLPVAVMDWATSIMRAKTSDQWPAFAITCGCIVLLSLGAWAVFRRKEL